MNSQPRNHSSPELESDEDDEDEDEDEDELLLLSSSSSASFSARRASSSSTRPACLAALRRLPFALAVAAFWFSLAMRFLSLCILYWQGCD